VIGLLIVLALVAVPLALLARLSILMLARLLGVVSHSEVATRAEFARIREQLLLGNGSARPPASEPLLPQPPVEPHWRVCPECGTSVSSAASTCMRCGGAQSVA
jgi:hypothetical protein